MCGKNHSGAPIYLQTINNDMAIFESTPEVRLTVDHYNRAGLIYRRRFDGEVPMVMIPPSFIQKFSLARYPGNYEIKIVPTGYPETNAFIFRKLEFTPKISDNGNNVIEIRYFLVLSYEGEVLYMDECTNPEEAEQRLNIAIRIFHPFKGLFTRPHAQVIYTTSDGWGTTINDRWFFRVQEGSRRDEILVRGVLSGGFTSIYSISEWFAYFVDRYKHTL